MDRPHKRRTYTLEEMTEVIARLLHREQTSGKPGDRVIEYSINDQHQFVRLVHTPAPERVL